MPHKVNPPDESRHSFDLDDSDHHRLKNPRFDLLEDRYQCVVPQSLRTLYENHEEIVRTGIFISIQTSPGKYEDFYVQAYEPIDESSLGSFPGYEKFFEFALCGGPFLYMIDPTKADPEVYLFNMEVSGYEMKPLGITLSQFVESPRRYEDV